MAQPKTPTNVPVGTVIGYDGTDFYPAHVDSEGKMRVHTQMDLVADLEITGTPTLNRGFTPGSSGSNTIVTVGANDRLMLYKAIISPSSDISGEVYLSVGATKVGTVQSPKAGGQYVLMSCFPDYEHGALGEDLTLNLPSSTTCSLYVSYEVYTP
jgi:hypothetical protein